MNTVRPQLTDEQLADFDTEYITGDRWSIIKKNLDKDFPSGDFTFLDIGGGNGQFADRLLREYPMSSGTVLDNSQLLLDRNSHNDRKTVINESIFELGSHPKKYDIVFLNWVLHHLVSNSYAHSRENIAQTLSYLPDLLTSQGKVSIFENMYDGIFIDALPGRLIFELTSNKNIAKIIKSMGANTAGVGVCFLSHRQWSSSFEKQALSIASYEDDTMKWYFSPLRRLALHLGNVRMGHFWLESSSFNQSDLEQ
jgi:hypothetical protein